jgi:hypothetical protein
MLVDALFSLLLPGHPWLLTVEDMQAAGSSVMIVGQGSTQGLRMNRSLDTHATSSPGDFRPAVAITGAQADQISFTSAWAAASILDDLEAIAKDLLSLADLDPMLGRTPILRLTVGDISEAVRLTSVDITWSEGRWDITGKHTGFEAAMTFVAHNEKNFSSLPFDPETTEVILDEVKTFESLAWEHYQDPELGLGLRRCNPTVLMETPGTRVKIYETGHAKMRSASKMTSPLISQETFNRDVIDRAMESLSWPSLPWANVSADDREFEGWD